MNPELTKLWNEFNLTADDYQAVQLLAPAFAVVTAAELERACQVLTDYGFPRDALGVILVTNPNLFLNHPDVLRERIQQLLTPDPDANLTEILLNDPYAL